MAPEPVNAAPHEGDPTIGRLVTDASRDISTLISKEIQLAKTELKMSFKAGGIGVGMFATAAFLGVMALIMLSVAIAYFIHWAGLGLHWSFLIVFGFYLLLAVLLVLIGVRKVKQVRAPERAIRQGKEIPSALKGKS